MKATTAYFVFAEENRKSVRDRILSENGEGAKASVCEIAKAIGVLWKELSDEQKDVYKQKALARSQVNSAAAEEADGSGEGGCRPMDAESTDPSPSDGLLPLSIVRRIALTDTDISRISHEGLVAIAKATDLLLGLMAKHASGQAKSQKRRTIMLKDFVQGVKQDRRLAQAGLRDVEAAVKAASEAEAVVKSSKAAALTAAADAEGHEAAQADDGVDGAGEETGADGRDTVAAGLDAENCDPHYLAGGGEENADKPIKAARKDGVRALVGRGKKLKVAASPANTKRIESFFGKPKAGQEAVCID